jgi:hypothetical protein
MRRMRRGLRLALFFGVFAAILVACGSRTALLDGEEVAITNDAASDVTMIDDRAPDRDAIPDTRVDSPDGKPFIEGGALDVTTDCPEAPYCDPRDLGNVYKCGVPIFQCSSLENCRNAKCVNPCQDTLGQDTSNGCEFFATEMDTVPEAEGVCFAVFVVNQWKTGEPARIEVDRGGQTLNVAQFARIPVGTGTNIAYTPYVASQGLARDQVAILFLSRDPAAANDSNPSAPRRLAGCPPGVTPAVVGDAALHGTGKGSSFHIKTNVPVVAYQMLPYGGGRARLTGATLLLPTNVWGQNYLAANAYAAPPMIGANRAGPTLVILGQEDGTQVKIKPTSSIVPGGGLVGTLSGVPITYTVNRGQYLQFTQSDELTGSAIESDKPVAVIGGSTLVDIPLQRTRADGAEQMLPPVSTLGSEYVAVRYRSRDKNAEESVPWRIVGAVDGTTLTYDPPVPGAPTTVNARQRIELNAPGPFVVSSQGSDHPFYFAQYMTGGCGADNINDERNCPFHGEGDPEFVNVITPSQFLPRYTFFTDPTYPETNLVVTRVKDASGVFPQVSLDCAGVLSGWQAVGSSGKYEFTRIDLSTGNFQGQNGCNNGVHTIVATVPGSDAASVTASFGATVWGWGSWVTDGRTQSPDEALPNFTRWVSYGYPVGVNVTKLNSVVVSAQ